MIYAYFIIIFFIGIYHRKNKSHEDYLYSSRSLTLPSFIATIVTTWYGGILEIGRFSYINGIVTWCIFGFFYYISAVIFALYIGPQLHKNNIDSIPKYFKEKYGVGRLASKHYDWMKHFNSLSNPEVRQSEALANWEAVQSLDVKQGALRLTRILESIV